MSFEQAVKQRNYWWRLMRQIEEKLARDETNFNLIADHKKARANYRYWNSEAFRLSREER